MVERLRVAGLTRLGLGPFGFSLGAGECLAISGRSGAGKSLLLRMVADLDPHEGEAWLDGAARSGMAAPAWRRRVVYCAAESGWWESVAGAHFGSPPVALAAELGLQAEIFARPIALCSSGERSTRRCCCSMSRPARSTRKALRGARACSPRGCKRG